jgi:hypothetical protein
MLGVSVVSLSRSSSRLVLVVEDFGVGAGSSMVRVAIDVLLLRFFD